MASLTITIPDANLTDVLDTLAIQWGYTGINPNTQLAETKAQFSKRIVAQWIKTQYQAGKADAAAQSAKVTSLSTTASVDIN